MVRFNNGVVKNPKVTVNERNVGASQHGLKGSLQAEDWGVDEFKLGSKHVKRCGFCAGRGKRKKPVVPSRSCVTCKKLVCLHLSGYKPDSLQVVCLSH